MSHTDAELIAEGRKVLALERSAIAATEAKLGDAFLRAVKLVLATHGNVIFCGVGKSGHIGRKLAATFASTGTPAIFVHADEAAHGDLGMIRPGDVFVGISFSGESDELSHSPGSEKTLGAHHRDDGARKEFLGAVRRCGIGHPGGTRSLPLEFGADGVHHRHDGPG